MQAVLEGFAIIAIVIGAGAVLARFGLFDLHDQERMTKLTFFVGSPALLFTVIAQADPSGLFTPMLAAILVAVLVGAALAIGLALLFWRATLSESMIAAMSAAYMNSNNLGLPIAVYVLGDARYVAPLLMLQLVVLQPLALVALDASTSSGRGAVTRLVKPLTNPMTVGSVLGLVVSASGITVPTVVWAPAELVGGLAVPTMLLAYGISLTLGPKPGTDGAWSRVVAMSTIKLLVVPAVGLAVASAVFGVEGHDLLVVGVLCALPTAQNVFILASRYRCGVVLARDSIAVTTLLSVPAVLGVVALVG